MGKGILGKKVGMTQIFDDEGRVVPVTVIESSSCVVVQVKIEETDGYTAVQLGLEEVDEKAVNSPQRGHFDKAGITPRRYLAEFRSENGDWSDVEVGEAVGPDVFDVGDRVKIRGISRGKGFAGTIKRHNTSRGPSTHGSRYHRGPGSSGASSFPSRVVRGRKLPGRMGGKRVTVENAEVVRIDTDRGLLLVKGPVPGARGGVVRIESK
ncbi:MAG: 50S ribosomal protein L3 [Clostridia bacterium]